MKRKGKENEHKTSEAKKDQFKVVKDVENIVDDTTNNNDEDFNLSKTRKKTVNVAVGKQLGLLPHS